ncbi:MAG: efflux RND transporter periplasmic adaptor subunit [Gammaproteobacteria bacterium]|nr:efflux RND transporter periplasmic adaptor subunit [Gammaproteobacteria bacterium]
MIRPLWLMAILAISVGCSDPEPSTPPSAPQPAKLHRVVSGNSDVRSFPGEVVPAEHADLAFRVAGVISELPVRSGQLVTKGTLLVRLDPSDLQLAQSAAKANFELAEVQYKRGEALVKDSLISRQSFDELTTARTQARAQLDAATTNLGYATLTAPYDGRIATINIEASEYVQAHQPVILFQSDNAVDVLFQLPNQLLPSLQSLQSLPTDRLSARFAVRPTTSYSVSFKKISTVANPDTGSFDVWVTLPVPADLRLLPGMAATVDIGPGWQSSLPERQLPASALMQEGNQTFVWRVDSQSGSIARTAVTLDGQRTVVSGLNDGDMIVAVGVHELNEGDRVKPWVKERGL